jgi:DNA-binding FadR family transcriptional regulator
MALRPVVRRSVSEQVSGQIAADIFARELLPGEALPGERKLAELFGVSRPAVREALQRLSAAGLIEVRHGGVTTVRDYRRHASPDILPQLLLHDGKLNTTVARSLLEARLRNGPKVAELAAECHGPELAEVLDESLRALESETDPVERRRHAVMFWDHVVDGTDSIVERLQYNAFRAAYEPALPLLTTAVGADVEQTEDYRRLAKAIVAGDAPAANNIAYDLVERTNGPLMAALDKIANQRPPDHRT